MRIACVDPGGRTGWALFEYIDTLRLLEAGQVGPGDHHLLLEETLYGLGELDLLIYERFEHRNDEFARLVSLEYIGVCKYFCQKYSVRSVEQGASQATKWATNDKMRALGFLKSPLFENKDENDAKRHGVFFMCNSDSVDIVVRRQILRQMFGKTK